MTRVTSNNHSYRPSVPHKEFKGFRKYINTHGHKFVFASILGIAASQAVKGFILKTLLVKASLILLAGVGLYKAVDTTFAIPPTGDITPPVATVSYSPDVSTLPQGLTNKDVNVILSFNEPALVSVDGVAISNGYVFNILSIYADNMTKVFTFSDVKGNTASLPVTVNYIDKIPPTANIEYQTLVISKKNVTIIATLTGFSEPITITNN